MRVLLLRSAPTWYCCTQPRAWSRSARRWRRAERKTRASPAASAWPARSRAKRPAATSSVNGSASIASRPWSEAPAAPLVEERVPLLEGGEERVPGPDRGAGRLLQLPEPGGPRRQVLDEEGLVRAPGREDLRVGVLPLRQLRVGLERVGGVVGAADDGHAELLQEAHRREGVLLQPLVGAVEGRPGGGGGEERLDAERPAQLHVRPVVERIARACRERSAPRPRTSPSPRRRPCRSARARRSPASLATCSGRPPARPPRSSGSGGRPP